MRNTIILYFCYEQDAAALQLSVESVRKVAPNVPIFVADDAAAPVKEKNAIKGVQWLTTNYNRGGTGKGLEAVQGELETMKAVLDAAKADYLIKLDPDVLVRDLNPLSAAWWTEAGKPHGDFVGMEGGRSLLPMGCAYRVSRWAVQFCLQQLKERSFLPGTYAEALTIWHLLSLSQMPKVLHSSDHGLLVGARLEPSGCRGLLNFSYDLADAAFIHCGEPYAENGQFTRASRELTMTRMLYLKNIFFSEY